MSRILKKSRASFYSDPQTPYAKDIDQSLWSESCMKLVKTMRSFVYKNPKILNDSAPEMFDHIIGRLMEGRKEIARIIGQKETYKLGVIRSSDSVEKKTGAKKFQDSFPMMTETDEKGILDLVMHMAQINYLKVKESTPELIISANVNESRCMVIYKFYGAESYVAVDKMSIPMFPEIYGGATLFYPVGNYQEDVKNRVGELLIKAFRSKNDAEVIDCAARMRWNMIASNYYCDGSASVATMAEALIYECHNFALFPRKESVIRNDMKCLLAPSEDIYAQQYKMEFHDGFAPKFRRDVKRADLKNSEYILDNQVIQHDLLDKLGSPL